MRLELDQPDLVKPTQAMHHGRGSRPPPVVGMGAQAKLGVERDGFVPHPSDVT